LKEEKITLVGREFEIRRNARRTRITVGIDASGKYFIGAPARCSTKELTQALAADIENMIERVEKRVGEVQPARAFKEGEPLYFRGKSYPLHRISDTTAPLLSFDGQAFFIREDTRGKEIDLFAAWYARRLFERLRETLPVWTKRIKVAPVRISVKNTKTLWGSCSTIGGITFCTRLALVPDDLFNYVVVHELVHLLHMNHSPAFWSEVENHIPDYKERRAKLRKNGQKYKWW